jgi:spore maturation protein CgeB
MRHKPTIAFFASSLLSAYWNGAATYYRGIIRALSERGFEITFYEPDILDRSNHRDIPVPEWAKVVVYPAETESDVAKAVRRAQGANVIVKASGVGAWDDYLEEAVLQFRDHGSTVIFWDVDAPATLDRISENSADPFLRLIPQYTFVFTYGGGHNVVAAYEGRGAALCIPIYNALDPHTHHPVPFDPAFEADLSFLGNRLPDREARVDEFFLRAAELSPDRRFILGGSGWDDKQTPLNVNYVGHVYTHQHNAFNCTPLAVLNVSRDSMARYGFSPATRVFEAAGAGACLVSDYWEGVDTFFEPGKEILVAKSADDVAEHLQGLTREKASQIGSAAIKRALAEHTYAQRAAEVERILNDGPARKPSKTSVLGGCE